MKMRALFLFRTRSHFAQTVLDRQGFSSRECQSSFIAILQEQSMPAHAICISRAIWTGAEAIASDVAKELGFRCVDEEILQMAAERRNLST